MKKKSQSEIARGAANLTWRRTTVGMEEFKIIHGNDYETFCKGWPDFVAYNKLSGEYRFIELKRENQIREKIEWILTEQQNKVRKILEKISGNKSCYEIWFFENKKGSEKIVKKAVCKGNKLEFYEDN